VKQGIKNNEDIEYFKGLYSKLFEKVKWYASTMDNPLFYRARIVDAPRLCSHIRELKYPPPKYVKKQGQLNNVGESIAYLSTNTLTPIAKLDIDYYQLYYMSEIEYDMKDIFFFMISVKADYEGLSDDEIEFVDFFSSLLTSPDKNVYPATIAFANMVFIEGIHGKNIKSGIAYNSAQEYKTNQVLHNIAVNLRCLIRVFGL